MRIIDDRGLTFVGASLVGLAYGSLWLLAGLGGLGGVIGGYIGVMSGWAAWSWLVERRWRKP